MPTNSVLETMKKTGLIIISILMLALTAVAQAGQNESDDLKYFREQLSRANAVFTVPEGFTETKPLNNPQTAYLYALAVPSGDFEVRFQIKNIKHKWRKLDHHNSDEPRENLDSLYNKIAMTQINSMAADVPTRKAIPRQMLQKYNADMGYSYFFSLTNSPFTKHYQYALLFIVRRKHAGIISVMCMGNDQGPDFFKRVNQLQNSLKFSY